MPVQVKAVQNAVATIRMCNDELQCGGTCIRDDPSIPVQSDVFRS